MRRIAAGVSRRSRSLPLVLALLLSPGAAPGETVVPPGAVARDAVWEGSVRASGIVEIGEDAVLTVKPGTVVLFAKGAGLNVAGRLVAVGSDNAPIRFAAGEPLSSPAGWNGIRFAGSRAGSVLERCSITRADAVVIESSSPAVRNCEIARGRVGIVVAMKGAAEISGNRIADMSEGGIMIGRESAPAVSGNSIAACALYGVSSAQGAAPVLRKNAVSGCGTGIGIFGAIPPVEGNVLEKNRVGLGCSSAGKALVIRGNSFRGNGIGLNCTQFSYPLVERNEFTGNDNAIVCVRMSSPLIRNNEIAGNRQGIVGSNISRPLIAANNIHGNRRGIFLTLSSYAVVHENNIYGNDIQIELGLMSSDWEARTAEKPERGRNARLGVRKERGLAGRREIAGAGQDGAEIRNEVDAAGNWWGEKATAEMERKGPDANIEGFVDHYDRPTHPSEGYPGEYVQDRINYRDWKKSRIEDAGITP